MFNIIVLFLHFCKAARDLRPWLRAQAYTSTCSCGKERVRKCSRLWEARSIDLFYVFIIVCVSVYCVFIFKNKHNIKQLAREFYGFFYLRKGDFLVIKYRFSQYRFMIRVRKFEIRIRSENLQIVYKNYLDCPSGSFWPFSVQYLVKP